MRTKTKDSIEWRVTVRSTQKLLVVFSSLKETLLYTNIPNIPKYQYTNTNYTQTGGKETRSQDKHLQCTKQIYTQHILSSFPSPSFVIHATKKKYTQQDKIELDVLYCVPFCVSPFVFLMRHDLYIYQPSIVYIQSYVLDILVFDVLLSIAFGNLPITYCCV